MRACARPPSDEDRQQRRNLLEQRDADLFVLTSTRTASNADQVLGDDVVLLAALREACHSRDSNVFARIPPCSSGRNTLREALRNDLNVGHLLPRQHKHGCSTELIRKNLILKIK